MTKIHVVIPVYNACKYLRSAVDSVLSQPYKGIDIVLVNDGSTDGSDAICNEIADAEERVTVIHQENRGVSAARNAGIQYFLDKETSDKDYIAFLDADDLWAPDVFTEDEALKLTSDVLGYSSYYANETVTRYRSLYAQQDKNVQKNSGIVFWLANGHFGSYLIQFYLLRFYNLQFPVGVMGNEDVIFLQEVGFCCEHVLLSSKALYVYRRNSESYTHTSKYNLENAAQIPCAWYDVSDWALSTQKFTFEMCMAWKKDCQQIAGARMLEAARGLARSGASFSEVYSFLMAGPYAELFEQIDRNGLAEWQKKDLNLYSNSPKLFWFKHRVVGMLNRVGRCALINRPLSCLYEHSKFRLT